MQRRNRGNSRHENTKAKNTKNKPNLIHLGLLSRMAVASGGEKMMKQDENWIVKRIVSPAEKVGPHYR